MSRHEVVSILIPAYNAERWLAQAIRSALAQTWPAKEVIVVDDGSTDDTLEVAKAFEGRGVIVVTQRNAGAAAARNRALSLAQGTYLQWLDADDLLSPNKVARQMQVAQKHGNPRTALSSPWGYFMYRTGKARFRRTALWENLAPIDWIVQKWKHNLHMQTATWLVSRELTEAAGVWDTTLLGDDDGEYFTRVVLASSEVVFVPESKVFYRVVGADRLSFIGVSGGKLEAHLRSMELQIANVRRREDTPEVRLAIVKYLQDWLPLFEPERPDLVERMRDLAGSVGGELQPSTIGWKYAAIDRLFGRVAAKGAKLRYNIWKTECLRSADRVLYSVFGD
jgi:glycosyltransferase involved in cell wall biosynthesis